MALLIQHLKSVSTHEIEKETNKITCIRRGKSTKTDEKMVVTHIEPKSARVHKRHAQFADYVSTNTDST